MTRGEKTRLGKVLLLVYLILFTICAFFSKTVAFLKISGLFFTIILGWWGLIYFIDVAFRYVKTGQLSFRNKEE